MPKTNGTQYLGNRRYAQAMYMMYARFAQESALADSTCLRRRKPVQAMRNAADGARGETTSTIDEVKNSSLTQKSHLTRDYSASVNCSLRSEL